MRLPRHATPLLLIGLLAAVPLGAKTRAVVSSAFGAESIKGNISRSPPNKAYVPAQSPQVAGRPNLRLPDEAAGLDGIVRTLISAFDQADVVALGEDHGQKLDSDVRMALLRHPDFPKKARFIVVEFANTAEQPTLDRYIQGEDVPIAKLERQQGLPAEARLRVLAGDPPTGSVMPRNASAVSVLKKEVLEKHGKALVIYGAAHFYRREVNQILLANGGGITKLLEADYPGRIFVVLPVSGPGPEFRKFESALTTRVRPVLVSLQRPPFRDFTAAEFIGRKLLNCLDARSVPGGCVSAFEGSGVTLGQLADACIYWRADADIGSKAKPVR